MSKKAKYELCHCELEEGTVYEGIEHDILCWDCCLEEDLIDMGFIEDENF